MTDSFKIAIAGLGTVGCGVIEILQNHADTISARAGRDIEIIASIFGIMFHYSPENWFVPNFHHWFRYYRRIVS